MEPQEEIKGQILIQEENKNPVQEKQEKNQQKTKSKVLPTEMEKKHVYEVYDRIAPHFSHTRYKPWPKIEGFLKELPDWSVVYDVGCGNGKYLGVNEKLHMIGTDRSVGLLKTARQKSQSYELFAADSLLLPVRSQLCDAAISIAVIHHFSNDQIRHQAISQLVRIIKVGGCVLIYVWAFEQDLQESVSKKKFTEQDVFVPWHLHFKYQEDLKKIDHQGMQVDNQKKTVVYKRYYHVFKKGELENLLKQHKNIQIIDSYYDKENWACIIKKISN